MRGGRVKRPTRQSLYKKAHFGFCRDCRVALRAPRNDESSAQCTVHSFGRGTLRGAFLCLVEIAASRFALLAMTLYQRYVYAPQSTLFVHSPRFAKTEKK
ncbi:MAG: hypothetical protein LBL66_03365 [Clostridiales bacterium]|nr:hypothetical protein [Clostridiales bacterium]